jgi:hypothetical protein
MVVVRLSPPPPSTPHHNSFVTIPLPPPDPTAHPPQVNCPFYFKIGACRHADRCSRIHHRPAFSQTILVKHVYRHPVREAELQAARDGRCVDVVVVDEDKAREDFLAFFE